MVVADGEVTSLAATDSWPPAQLLLGGDQTRHLLVEGDDALAGGARLGHGLAVPGGQRLET